MMPENDINPSSSSMTYIQAPRARRQGLWLLVAIAALGRNLGILDAAESSAVILLAITSGVIFPIGFKLLIGKSSQAS